MNNVHEFRSRVIYEFYLALQVMSIFGIILLYKYFFQNEFTYSLIFVIVYTSFVIVKVGIFVHKVYFKGAEDYFPVAWSIFLDGIFLCFFLYLARDFFYILSHLFYIYLVLITMISNRKLTKVCSYFTAMCYVVLVIIQEDLTALASLDVVVHILLFYLLGHIMSTMVDEINKLENKMCYMYDDLEHKNHMLNEMVSKDFLTNLNNHKTFYIYYKDIILRSCKSKSAFSLAILDIDDFKKINDTYGHLAGDKILQEISCLIQANIRKTDVAARYGGEEFAIIFPDTLSKDSAEICERIRNTIAAHVFSIDNQAITVTISGGVAGGVCLDPYYKRNILFNFVDQLLYQAKSEGKNQILCSHELILITE
ncbi:GGDEF domain-containing protein [Desulfosporosinus hippei]|uniref:Diguanylate cyclase (GGDEF) domain-containing protein n=1 Tax=Desulfosporosinus hippei DSM 8344 TaxID=1121419 RepID=A0A1G8G2L9_9FIRM|nr:GGDEF domain-containing protein [Desulfosporosinus hippei]SDH88622.1 diguanylate cyclase (GGDEF) domain-containing protein [Desulfosporosinus hippei DSM 8344]